ncbi:MAG: DUF3021 domain-containing protein [Clostridia bacterium]|nr:DUF3021 domain-containing protein [Clostridia bacterium]
MLWKKATLSALIGFVIGVLIGVGFMQGDLSGLREALPHLLLGGIYGAVACGSSVVYDTEKWSIARATATHFLFVFSLYLLIVFTMDWFRLGDPVFWIVIAVMVMAYILIWLFQYLVYKRKIREMNNDLARMKSRADKN